MNSHLAAAPPAEPQLQTGRATRRASRVPAREQAVCYHCASTDTMEPFARPERILILSRIFPRLRRRYCRACTKHFIAVLRP